MIRFFRWLVFRVQCWWFLLRWRNRNRELSWANRQKLVAKIEEVLETLECDEAEVVRMIYGLKDEPYTIEDAADELGVSDAYVKEALRCARQKLADPERSGVLEDYLDGLSKGVR